MTESVPAPIRILLVDDHLVVRMGLSLLIQKNPSLSIVGETGSLAEAIEAIGRTQPDVILLDLDLGNESGLDAIPVLLEAAPSARIVILTGVRDVEVHRKAIRAGAVGVVPKSHAADTVVAAIQRVHAGEVWLDPRLTASLLQEISAPGRRRQVDPEEAKIAALTKREREVVGLVGQGMKSRDIAEKLFISETTVRHHLTSIFSKLDVEDRVALMMYSYRHGLAKPPT